MRNIHYLSMRWTPVILRHLASKGTETFERLREETRASPRMLSRTLRHLVEGGLVAHNERAGSYAITTNGGKSLLVLRDSEAIDGIYPPGVERRVSSAAATKPAGRFVEAPAERPESWDL